MRRDREKLLRSIQALPDDFHEAGVMTDGVLAKLFELLTDNRILRSAETGCGKTALLFSHLSERHTVFTLKSYGDIPCASYENVVSSDLFNSASTEFVLGPTQRTLPQYTFTDTYQFVLLDGPHGFPFPALEYYYFYPHIEEGGFLVVDDVHIPSVAMLSDFLSQDAMFDFVEQVENTAIFRRTAAPTFNPEGDDWWLQGFNRKVGSGAGWWRRMLGRVVR